MTLVTFIRHSGASRISINCLVLPLLVVLARRERRPTRIPTPAATLPTIHSAFSLKNDQPSLQGSIANAMRGRSDPANACAQLGTYIKNIEQFAAAQMEPDETDRLMRELHVVAEVPGYYRRDFALDLAGEFRSRWFRRPSFEQSLQ